jgi:hypothetical protein
MNNIFKVITLSAVLVIINVSFVYAKPRLEYGQPLKTYTSSSGLDIVSYSPKWSTDKKLDEVYKELLNNFHADELNYLDAIYIYPDSPDGTNGYYYEAATINKEGKYSYGKDAYIEIFNGDDYNDISQMAWVLSHEYGHHFTFYYLVTAENKYSNQWYDTGYAKIRKLAKYDKVNYNNDDPDTYMHRWDITEIAAEDYVQLFGSPLAKKSTDYKDVAERLKDNMSDYSYLNSSYNLLPQENLSLPLAADVDGLYNYWLNLTGYTAAQPSLSDKPIPYISNVEKVYFDSNKKYTLKWNEIPDNKAYEYTVVMYPKDMSYFPIPIKTVKTGEEMVAYIGSDVKHENNDAYGILEQFEGEYEIRVFVKDINNFMFVSQTLYYDFTNGISHYDEGILKNANIKEQRSKLIKAQPIAFEALYEPIFSNQQLVINRVVNEGAQTKEIVIIKDTMNGNLPMLSYYASGNYIPAQRKLEKLYERPIIKLCSGFGDNSIINNNRRQT